MWTKSYLCKHVSRITLMIRSTKINSIINKNAHQVKLLSQILKICLVIVNTFCCVKYLLHLFLFQVIIMHGTYTCDVHTCAYMRYLIYKQTRYSYHSS